MKQKPNRDAANELSSGVEATHLLSKPLLPSYGPASSYIPSSIPIKPFLACPNRQISPLSGLRATRRVCGSAEGL